MELTQESNVLWNPVKLGYEAKFETEKCNLKWKIVSKNDGGREEGNERGKGGRN